MAASDRTCATCNLADFFPDSKSFTLRSNLWTDDQATLKHVHLRSFKRKFSSNPTEFKFCHARVNQVVSDKQIFTHPLLSLSLSLLITFGCYYNRKQTHRKQGAVLAAVPSPLSYGKGIKKTSITDTVCIPFLNSKNLR